MKVRNIVLKNSIQRCRIASDAGILKLLYYCQQSFSASFSAVDEPGESRNNISSPNKIRELSCLVPIVTALNPQPISS